MKVTVTDEQVTTNVDGKQLARQLFRQGVSDEEIISTLKSKGISCMLVPTYHGLRIVNTIYFCDRNTERWQYYPHVLLS